MFLHQERNYIDNDKNETTKTEDFRIGSVDSMEEMERRFEKVS